MTPNLDSELRFYAAWYAVGGWLMHEAAKNSRVDRDIAPVLTGGWLLGSFSRLLSMRSVGRPTPFFLLLTGLEVAIAAVLAATHPRDE